MALVVQFKRKRLAWEWIVLCLCPLVCKSTYSAWSLGVIQDRRNTFSVFITTGNLNPTVMHMGNMKWTKKKIPTSGPQFIHICLQCEFLMLFGMAHVVVHFFAIMFCAKSRMNLKWQLLWMHENEGNARARDWARARARPLTVTFT